MPSRKRNKGKERKAKKAAVIENVIEKLRSEWMGWARGENMLDSGRVITQCNHVSDLMIPEDPNPNQYHRVSCFMDVFYMNMRNRMGLENNLRCTFQTQQQVWNNGDYRKLARDLMLVMGTNTVLSRNAIGMAKHLACAITTLENYDGSGEIDSTINSRVVSKKARDLLRGSDNMRDVLKFYRKRVPCSCLRDMHLEARKILPKLGVCFCCEAVKDRALLMVCSRCRLSQYCSRECQVADWPSHKRECVTCARVQKEQFMDSNST